jgi:hypothetical protein
MNASLFISCVMRYLALEAAEFDSISAVTDTVQTFEPSSEAL